MINTVSELIETPFKEKDPAKQLYTITILELPQFPDDGFSAANIQVGLPENRTISLDYLESHVGEVEQLPDVERNCISSGCCLQNRYLKIFVEKDETARMSKQISLIMESPDFVIIELHHAVQIYYGSTLSIRGRKCLKDCRIKHSNDSCGGLNCFPRIMKFDKGKVSTVIDMLDM